MIGKVYLSRTMLRRILASFALITGLATLGAPAQARMMAVMSQSVVESTQAQTNAVQPGCQAEVTRPDLRTRSSERPGCRPQKPIVIVIPTIQLGADRARE